MSIKIKVNTTNKKNKEAYKKLQELLDLQNTKIEYGFFADKVYTEADVSPITGEQSAPPGTHVAEIAYVQETGVNTPKRDFFTRADNELKRQSSKLIGSEVKKFMYTGNKLTLLNSIGKIAEELVKDNIESYPGSNAPLTVALKGFDDPLRWSGKMLDSVDYRIVKSV